MIIFQLPIQLDTKYNSYEKQCQSVSEFTLSGTGVSSSPLFLVPRPPRIRLDLGSLVALLDNFVDY